MNIFAEQKRTHRHGEQTCSCQGVGKKGGSGMDWEFGVNRCKLLHLEWIDNEVLRYSTGSNVQSLVMEHDKRYPEKENVYRHMTGSLCCSAKTDRTM